MNFRRHKREDPEINLIPFIDVLLVVLIFLMLSTTYSRFSELQINLPTADADRLKEQPAEILVSVGADGRYAINRVPLDGRSIELLAASLQAAAGGAAGGANAPVVIVSADALATHQSVINVLDAARRANLPRLTFATQLPGDAAR
ncbi:MAG: biopolymer transporter ExbD [Burkholderiaceae bacterium]|nr:biopolymer transporter ExbD [Burkholderiaceae bacterium]